jgi:CheY-like chemotaxis protein
MENKKVRLLIVDDNDHNLELVKRVLKDEGYELLFADNGRKALEVLAVIKIDLILLDVMMPGIDGFETCRVIKENPNLVNIPRILVDTQCRDAPVPPE